MMPDNDPAVFVVNVQVALRHGDHVLVIERSPNASHAPGVVDLPGGKVDRHEILPGVLETVARRELLEETGIDSAEQLRYVCSASFVADAGFRVVNVVFAAESKHQSVPKVTDPYIVGARWMAIDEALTNTSIPDWSRDYIRRAFVS